VQERAVAHGARGHARVVEQPIDLVRVRVRVRDRVRVRVRRPIDLVRARAGVRVRAER